ncbi:hypothetical protein [Moorena sp. SIO3I6]|uniref:hypothetical protein n=1 Tax=Moorena sp. SIO3I6 TaxID=2607831 RepID=UPI0013F9C60D|nr:hypothetical protein [Moorena sp. SIO3I6]NEP26123.1 hypothetical protein [Moorena sp. SIO3I6]
MNILPKAKRQQATGNRQQARGERDSQFYCLIKKDILGLHLTLHKKNKGALGILVKVLLINTANSKK